MRAKLALLMIALLILGIFVVGCAPEVEDDGGFDDFGEAPVMEMAMDTGLSGVSGMNIPGLA